MECDLQYVEKYAQKYKISNLTDVFTELKQLINLLNLETLDSFLDQNVRKQQFGKLTDLHRLIKILEKYKEESRFLNRKGPKEKSVDHVISQLKKESK